MDKKQQIQSQVKSIIMGANLSLEAHKYGQAKQICREALELEKDNPNIYLIMLLADYKVTEIEDLKNCKVDFESENYKNVRRYAGKELNDELNKYLSDKYTYEERKSSFNVDSKVNDAINYLKKLKYIELLKDFVGYDYFTTELYNNKLTLELKEDKNVVRNTKNDTLIQNLSPIVLVSLVISAISLFVFILMCFTNAKYLTCIGTLIGGILLFFRIKSIQNLEVIVTIPRKRKTFSEKLTPTLGNLAGSIFSFIAIYYLYFKYFDLINSNNSQSFIISMFAFFIVLIPQRIVPIYYQQFYSLLKNIHYLFENK